MKIFNADLNIDILEFSDRFENIRSTSGCTIKGKIEFDARLQILGEIINKVQDKDPTKPIGIIYLENKEFAHNCDRCLELNGINPEWLTESHIFALLFKYGKGAGMLVTLNAINNQGVERGQRAEGRGQRGNVYHQMLAGLYKLTGDPEQALKFAETRSLKDLTGMLNATRDKSKIPLSKTTPTRPKAPTAKQPSPEDRSEGISDRSFLRIMKARAMSRGEL